MNPFARLAQTFPPASVPAPSHPNSSTSLLGLVRSAVVIAALLFFSGCAATPTDRAAKLLASTVQTVNVAMQGYATAYVLGSVPEDDHQKVLQIYADYQAAVALAETAITNAINSGDAGSLAAATALLTEQQTQLLAFLARFTNSPNK